MIYPKTPHNKLTVTWEDDQEYETPPQVKPTTASVVLAMNIEVPLCKVWFVFAQGQEHYSHEVDATNLLAQRNTRRRDTRRRDTQKEHRY